MQELPKSGRATIGYSYVFDEDTRVDFEVDPTGEPCREDDRSPYPEWTHLDRDRCEGCPVEPGSRITCPAALALRPLVDAFQNRISYEQVQLVVTRRDVRIEAKLPTQAAIRSLMDLLLSLSACPILARLRPLAHLHMPLGTRHRTVFRYLGMHLIAQYMRASDGHTADWQLEELSSFLKQLRTVHRHLADRLRAATVEDAAVNALVLVDVSVDSVEWSIERSLEQLRPVFASYLAARGD
jgi:hypothetical protein